MALFCPTCHGGPLGVHRRFPGPVHRPQVTFRRCGSCGSLADVEGAAWEYRVEDAALAPEALLPDVRLILEGATPHRALAGHVQALHAARGGAGTTGLRWLDVGAHLGLACEFAERLGYSVTGLEPGALRAASQAVFGRHLRPERLEDLGRSGERFDRVLLSEVVEHVEAPGAFLAALRAVTAPSGLVLLSTPDADLLANPGHPQALDALYCPGHHRNILSPAALRRLLHRAGFGGVSIRPGTPASPSMLVLASPSPRACPPVPGPRAVRRGVRRWLPRVLRELSGACGHDPRALPGIAARAAAWALVELHESAGDTGAADRVAAGLALEVAAERWLEGPGPVAPSIPAYLASYPGFAPGLALALGRTARRRGDASAPAWLAAAQAHADLQQRLGTFMPGAVAPAAQLELAAWELAQGRASTAAHLVARGPGTPAYPGRTEGTRRLLEAHCLAAQGRWSEALGALSRAVARGRPPVPLAAWPRLRRAATRLGL